MMVTGAIQFNPGKKRLADETVPHLERARRLAEAAARALGEAEARRREIEARVGALAPEVGARRKKEPVRYGDWEVKGIASDF
jgi:hypothetical protein